MEVVDIGGLEGPRFTAAHELHVRFDRQLDPHLPPATPHELRLLATVDRTENATHHRVAAFEGDRAVALGHIELTHDPANPEFCVVEVNGLDDEAGRAVLVDLLDRAEADARTSMLGWGLLTPERSRFWTDLGAPQRYTECTSQLDVTAVDEKLMQTWIDDRERRAADITLVSWVGSCPDGHLDAFVSTRNAMNDAPIDNIDLADTIVTAESARGEELALAAIGTETWVLLAIDPDGAAVAMTAVHVNTHRAEASWQWDTVVLSAFRRRGIGRWIKAAMWRWLRDDRPDVTHLRTGNAQSNEAMLSINTAMGYEPRRVMAAWQADVAVLRASLAGAEQPQGRSS